MKFVEYIKETKGELKHVSWPTRKQAVGYTVAVVLISLSTALYLGAFDSLFSFLLDALLLK